VSSTLHQFLIQWINDEIEVVQTDASAYIALTDALDDWKHGSVRCLSGRGVSGYNFLSITKDGFVSVSAQLASKAQLDDVGFQ
jgi:hypothetical protein